MTTSLSNDLQLLQAHRDGDAEAFAELVRRHVDWIHNVARRRVGGDAQLAEDVTQATFLALAKQSAKLNSHAALPAWLFRVTCYIAAQVRRSESRRRRHERESVVERSSMDRSADAIADEWRSLAPMIDECVGKLRQADREAILLRFYRQMTFAEVGLVMSISEEASRKRVARAIEQLRSIARRRGLMFSGAAALGVALTQGFAASTASAAPAGIVALATTSAHAGATSSAALAAHTGSLVKGALVMTTSTKIMLASMAAVALIGSVVVIAVAKRSTAPAVASQTTKDSALAKAAVTADMDANMATRKTNEPTYGPDGLTQGGWTRELMEAAGPMKVTGILLEQAAIKNKSRYPSDVGGCLLFLKRGTTPAQAAAIFVSPGDLKQVSIPETIDAAWINAHTSYTYLVADASYKALDVQPLPGQTITFHSSLDRPFKHPRDGDVILATFVDGHAEILSIDSARKVIATSKSQIAKAITATTP